MEGRSAAVRWFVLAMTAVALLVVLTQLDRILIELGYPEPDGGGMAALHKADSVESWGPAAIEAAGIQGNPLAIAVVYLVLDVLLIAVYTILLMLSALGLKSQLQAGDRWRKPLELVLNGTLAFTIGLALVDLLEDSVQALTLAGADLGSTLPVLAAIKWTLLGLALLGLALATARLVRESWKEQTRRILRTLAVLRFQLVAVAGLALLLFAPVAGAQTADAILRWGIAGGWLAAAIGVAMILLLALTLFATAHDSVRADEDAHRRPLKPLLLIVIGGGLAILAAALGVFDDGEGAGLAVLGVLLAVIGLLSWPANMTSAPLSEEDREKDRQRAEERSATTLLPALLAAAPPLLLGLAILAATTGQLALLGISGEPEWTAVTGLGVALLVVSAFVFGRAWGAETGDVRRAIQAGSWLAVATTVAVTGAIYVDAWWTTELTGSIGAVAAFLIAVVVAGWMIARAERHRAPPAALRFAGFRRMPVLTLLAAASIGTMILDETGDHTIRTEQLAEGVEPAKTRITANQALTRWWEANDPEQRQVTPLVFVAASGGGIRAAYWTARVLSCAFERQGPPDDCDQQPGDGPAPLDRLHQAVFVASGVSGGSLGLASYAARLGAEDGAIAPGDDWVDERLGDDYLAPTLARMLFTDIPKALTGVHRGGDRATVLERSWERSWSDVPAASPQAGDEGVLAEGLRESWAANERSPLLVLNGTDVSRACRVSTSVLDADVEDREELRARRRVTADCHSQRSFIAPSAEDRARMASWALPATHDLIDHLGCEDGSRDVPLSTAALLSARFPFVSPSARIALCSGEEAIDVVDGGYLENSGASTALEIWQSLAEEVAKLNAKLRAMTPKRCIVPVFVQIDNDYVRDRAPGAAQPHRPLEPLVPPRVFTRVRHGNAAGARQASALAFRDERLWLDGTAVDRYVQLYPSFHPGAKAPLGWLLSEPSMDSLDGQLANQPRTEEALATIEKWFDPQARCAAKPRSRKTPRLPSTTG